MTGNAKSKKKSLNEHFEYIKSAGDISEYRLKKNGLSVLLLENNSLPLVNVMMTYLVGSRNEAVGYTGSAHLLEHLMFKGSKNFNKRNKKEIWNILEARGAKMNASTSVDFTNYYELIPKEHIEDALAIEADRMRNAFIRESDRKSEMTVVRNEFEWGENSPMEALEKEVWAAAFREHPYHHPTIGWRCDVENVSIKKLKDFYSTYYWPDNAFLSVVGAIEPKDALGKIYKYFGGIKSSPKEIPQIYTTEPRQEGEKRVMVTRAGAEKLVCVAHKIPEALNDDTYPLMALADILSGGKSGRLYRALVDKGLAVDVGLYSFALRDPGLFMAFIRLSLRTESERVEEAVLAEYKKIIKHGVSERELDRAKRRVISEEAFSRDGRFRLAGELNEAIAVGDWTFYVNFSKRVSEVKCEDVQRVAREYLTDLSKTVGWFVPKSAVK